MKWIKINSEADLPPFNIQVLVINKWYEEPYTAILVHEKYPADFDVFQAHNKAIEGYDLDPDTSYATGGDITHWAEIDYPGKTE